MGGGGLLGFLLIIFYRSSGRVREVSGACNFYFGVFLAEVLIRVLFIHFLRADIGTIDHGVFRRICDSDWSFVKLPQLQ